MAFIITTLEDWTIDYADGYFNNKNAMITLKSEYVTEQRKREVIMHELSRALRIGNLYLKDNENGVTKVITNDFRANNNYGNYFNECFNTIIEDYLLCEDYENYFNSDYHMYSFSGYSKTKYAYQLLKLLPIYDINTFLTTDANYLEFILSSYGLEDLIDLYDIKLGSERNEDVVLTNDNLIKECEIKILEKRVEQMVNNGYSYERINKFISKFPEIDYILNDFSNDVKYGENWEYGFNGMADTIEKEVVSIDDNGNEVIVKNEFYNPKISVYMNDNVIYDDYVYDGKNFNNSKLNLIAVKENGLINYKFVLLNDNVCLDITNNKPFIYNDSNSIIRPLTDFINILNLNIEINYDNFIKSDICTNLGQELLNKINQEQIVGNIIK